MAWPTIASWDVAWDDLVFIYNFLVTVMTGSQDGKWSSFIRMKRACLKMKGAKNPKTARDAIAITIISDSVISKFHKLKWTWANLTAYKPETAFTRKRTRKSPGKKTPIASTTIDDDDTPIVVADAAKNSIAKLLSVDDLPPDVQIRVWEGLADWATIERIQVSVAARAVRVPLPPSATPPRFPPHRPR